MTHPSSRPTNVEPSPENPVPQPATVPEPTLITATSDESQTERISKTPIEKDSGKESRINHQFKDLRENNDSLSVSPVPNDSKTDKVSNPTEEDLNLDTDELTKIRKLRCVYFKRFIDRDFH